MLRILKCLGLGQGKGHPNTHPLTGLVRLLNLSFQLPKHQKRHFMLFKNTFRNHRKRPTWMTMARRLVLGLVLTAPVFPTWLTPTVPWQRYNHSADLGHWRTFACSDLLFLRILCRCPSEVSSFGTTEYLRIQTRQLRKEFTLYVNNDPINPAFPLRVWWGEQAPAQAPEGTPHHLSQLLWVTEKPGQLPFYSSFRIPGVDPELSPAALSTPMSQLATAPSVQSHLFKEDDLLER